MKYERYRASVSAMSPLQRRYLAEMAKGAQVICHSVTGGKYEAWREVGDDFRLMRTAKGLDLAGMSSLRTLFPMVVSDKNEKYDYEFLCLPGEFREAANELLTLTMPVPDVIRVQHEYQQRQLQLTDLDESLTREFESPRM